MTDYIIIKDILMDYYKDAADAGELQQVSKSVLDISPFTHVPKLLVSDVSVLPLIGLAVVATALTAAGLAGLQRRDIQ